MENDCVIVNFAKYGLVLFIYIFFCWSVAWNILSFLDALYVVCWMLLLSLVFFIFLFQTLLKYCTNSPSTIYVCYMIHSPMPHPYWLHHPILSLTLFFFPCVCVYPFFPPPISLGQFPLKHHFYIIISWSEHVFFVCLCLFFDE